MSSFIHKRGMTFTGTITYTPAEGGEPNLLGTDITSYVLDAAGKRHELAVTLSESGLVVTCVGSYSVTELWAVGLARWDLRVEEGGVAIYTDTVDFDVVERITPTPSA